MFCKYCGQELPDDSKFCFNCGRQLTSNPVKTNAGQAKKKPVRKDPVVKPVKPVTQQAGLPDAFVYFKYVGIIAPIIAGLTFFLKWVQVKNEFIGYLGYYLGGVKESYSYLSICKEAASHSAVFAVVLISSFVPIIAVIVLQLTNHPRFSLIGWGCMIFPIGYILMIMADDDITNYFKLAAGFSLYVFLYILIFLSGLLTKIIKE